LYNYIMIRVLCLLVSVSAFANEAPVARVIGTQPVEVDGITAPASNFVPLSIGGQVSTKGGAAVIQFVDGTSVTLQPNSQLKIEGQSSRPTVRIVRGSAEYRMTLASRVRVSSGTGLTVDSMMDHAVAQVNAVASPNSSIAQAVMYRGVSGQSGMVFPTAVISGGGFALASLTSPTFRASGPGSSPALVTPGGLTINLSPIFGPNGDVSGYTVTSLTQIVTEPNGQTATIAVTSGSIVGATVTGINGLTTGGSLVNVQFTLPGQSVPLGPDQLSQNVQQGLNNALNTAIQGGSVPAGTTISPPRVSTTTFSNSAP
jgi:hypothetical protein